MEIWKNISNWEGIYQISNKGRVKSLPRLSPYKRGFRKVAEKVLKPRKSGKPTPEGKHYLKVILCKDGYREQHTVHSLVAKHFVANPNKLPCVMHLDDNPENNWDTNLKWGTIKDNNRDRHLKGRDYIPKPTEVNTNVLSYQDVEEIKHRIQKGETQQDIAKSFNIHQATVSKIKLNKIWKQA